MDNVVSRAIGLLCSCFLLQLAIPIQAQTSLDREPPGPSSRRTGLAITEIMYNPRPEPGLATNLTREFIEVFNSKPWDEDISGFSITGTVAYVFPPNTVLRPGAYLAVARVPDIIRTNYGITNVFGPWIGAETNRLSTEEGTVQLRNRQGALLLSVNYEDSPPWPEAADGAGHSLVLARPSYGEDDFRAWSQSDVVGGSPGRVDPVPNEPLASIFINEWQHHSDPVDWIELYNHSNSSVDMSGAQLTDNPQGTNAFRIPNLTSIGPRGFLSYDQNQLGFQLFAGGETIFLWNANQTRLIDVIDFRGGSNNVSQGRWPDGGPNIYNLNYQGSVTMPNNASNPRPARSGVVISEIMFNPISGNVDDEYIEIVNRNNNPISLAGWEFVTGINFLFPTNTMTMNMPAGAHWVIARNPTNLMAIYTNLSTNNVLGPYGGTLANGGERVVLAAADYDRVQGGGGGEVVERLNVPMSEVNYGDGGKWGNWSDGAGSSLELIDYEADERHPSNWADSNDTGESLWTAIEYNGPLGESLGSPVNDSVMVMLQGIGECLVDEVEVRADNGPNLVANGGFESGLSSWALQGSHDFSTIENEGFAGTRSLHVRAGSRGDNQSNRILSAPFASPIPPGTTTVSIRAKVRWLRGHPEVLLRLHGSATEAYGRLALPRRLGTPGAPNSRLVSNAGPAVYEVKHAPLLPAANEPVVVTARATDRQTPFTLRLRYRVDPTPTYTDVTMRDDGTGGDAIFNDGIFSGTIPAQATNTMVAFYVEARDSQNAIGTFPREVFPPAGFTRCWPNDAVARECVVRWGEVQMPGDFATYHLWVTAANSNRWHHRDTQNNTAMDGTFVYNNARVIYNALPLYSGSPWHRTNATTGPAGPNRVDYEMNFPDDDPLVGSTDFVLNNPGNPDRLTISDLSAVAEQTVYRIFEGLGLPNNHRRYIHFFVNGSQRSTAHERTGNFIFEDSQQPNGDVIAQWFPNDAGGQLFKVEDWFEFHENGFDITANNDADLVRRTVMLDGQPTFLPGTYRFMFRKRSVGVGASANDYSLIYALVDAASPAENPNGPLVDPVLLATQVNWEAWMRHFAIQRAVGNWDSYGWDRGKNDYLYRTAQGFVHMPWDIDYSLGLGRPANEPLFASNDPRVAAMFNTPAIVRAYWRAFQDIVDGPFNNATLDPFIDSRAATLLANNVNIDTTAVAAIKTYIGDRRAYLQSQLATVSAPFAIAGPALFDTANNLLVITGTAPVMVRDIALNGAVYPVTWTNVTTFVVRVVLNPGLNEIALVGLDRFGSNVVGASNFVSVNYTGPVVDPIGSLVFSEIMSTPAVPNAQFIEIVNRAQFNFDLSGWRVDGAGLTFPLGSIVTNGQTIVLARNRDAFRQAHGSIPPFAIFNTTLPAAGTRLVLVRPAGGDVVIDGVNYENAPPWAVTTNGLSLQLIDLTQENSRPSNWAVDPMAGATPGAPNSVAASLTPYDALWLNEVQIESLVGPLDNLNESAPWLELLNSGATPIPLAGYYLAGNFTSNLVEWSFPADAVLAPGERRLIWGDGQPEQTEGTNLHTSLRFERVGRLALVRLLSGQPQVVDYLNWQLRDANVAYGSFPEGQSVFRTLLHDATARAANVRRPLAVMINEWMARNSSGIADPADGAQDDWFEVYNGENRPIDLGGFYFSESTLLPTQSRVPANGRYVIPAGGFLLVWADNQTNQNSAARTNLHVAFNLPGGGGQINLYAPDGVTLIDSVTYGAQTQDISEGRYGDGAGAIYAMATPTNTIPTPSGRNRHPTYNTPPRFPVIANQLALPGTLPTPTVAASDPDVPPQSLIYEIVSGPEVSQINQSGRYRWIVPTNQPPGQYPVTLRVADNGVPPRSDMVTFFMVVPGPGGTIVGAPPPLIHSVFGIDGRATFTIDTIPGRTYRVLYTDDLGTGNWNQLDRDFVAANPYASLSDIMTAPHRFYVVVQLD